MPLDAICLSAVAEELRAAVLGGKIDKIYQPVRDEIVMAVRGSRENVKLLLSASPNHPRVQLTRITRENPDTPPMFCMLLRKHLTGARILDITQPPVERLVEFKLECLDELGDRVERRLVVELMGRSANLILLDGEGRILHAVVDELEAQVTADEAGVALPGDLRTKRQKGDEDYPLSAVSGIGKSWAEQADALAKHLEGMTASEVAALKTDSEGKAEDPDLLAGCTIEIEGYRDAIAKACREAKPIA